MKDELLTLLIILSIAGVIGVFIYVCNQIENKSITDQYKMYYGVPDTVKHQPNGLYFREDGYYCVWIKDRDLKDIMQTDHHEICHHLIYKNREHFCR